MQAGRFNCSMMWLGTVSRGDLQRAYLAYFGCKPSDEEVGAWENSITALAGIFADAGLEDHAVAIEYQSSLTPHRTCCMITGRDDVLGDNAAVLELKKWKFCDLPRCWARCRLGLTGSSGL